MASTVTFNYKGTYDENWPLPANLTLEQYSHVIFRPDAHFVDGRIVPRTLGDHTHSRMVAEITSKLYPLYEAAHLSCCISLRLRISPSRIRVCDFVVLQADAPREDVPTVPPLLCVEVLSDGQSPEDEIETLADYLTMGVENIWLIDPIYRAAFTFDAAGLHKADPTSLRVPKTPIHLDLTSAFAALD
jgi:Uma2 family endonuclease